MTNSKVADLAGPGIGNYDELEKILPTDYSSALTRRETQKAIHAVKRFIEDILCNGIGDSLEDGYPHEMRAAAYDDWITETHGTASTATCSSGTMSRNGATNSVRWAFV